MSLLKTFSQKFGFTAEEDNENEVELEEDEIDDEEEDDADEEEGSFSFRFPSNPFKRRSRTSQNMRNTRVVSQPQMEEGPEEEQPSSRSTRYAGSNVIHDPRMSAQAVQEPQYTHCERIVNVRQIEECREIIKCLLHGESILLNLENIDPKDCGRVVDLLSGAAFALQGRMLKVAHLSYLLAPENVEVIEADLYATGGQTRYR